jgi:hypothetical protein
MPSAPPQRLSLQPEQPLPLSMVPRRRTAGAGAGPSAGASVTAFIGQRRRRRSALR